MFSMPQEQYLDTLEEDPGRVKGDLYDLVCNGVELASGSIRIHDPELQKRIFNIIGLSLEEAGRRFGFLLEAFKYGAPPHGGIAPGLDRLVMLMAGESTIREVITFPKNTLGLSPMDDSPSPVGREQLEELHLKITQSAP
jgi:aspartyl-tRNA synthetase